MKVNAFTSYLVAVFKAGNVCNLVSSSKVFYHLGKFLDLARPNTASLAVITIAAYGGWCAGRDLLELTFPLTARRGFFINVGNLDRAGAIS